MKQEISNILNDLRSGDLSISEMPGFEAMLCRKIAWASIVIVISFSIGYLIGK